MTNSRDAILQRVRAAVQAGNRPGSVVALEARGGIGYQGGGPDPVTRFTAECTAAGGQVHVVADRAAARAVVAALLQGKGVRKAIVALRPVVAALGLPDFLAPLGIEVAMMASLSTESCRGPFFAADAGISGVDYLIAETGTVVLQASPEEARSVSLLPPLHIAIAEREQLLPDLFDLFEAMPTSESATPAPKLPSCISLITGPSKTGDIELRLVTGVHGPGELHVVLISA